MSTAIKQGVNCIFVAILTIGGVLALVSLPEFTLKPLYWASEQFEKADRPTNAAYSSSAASEKNFTRASRTVSNP
jgi:hypothetical protein